MRVEEALKILNSKFEYKADKIRWLDQWRIMSNDGDKWLGDCEDYSLTLAWLVSDKNILKFIWNLITFKFLIWYVLSPNGEGHGIIKIGSLYYDNIQKKGVTKEVLRQKGYKFRLPLLFPTVFFKLLIGYLASFFIKH